VPAFVNTGVAFYTFDATGGCTTHWFNDNDLLIREQDPLGNITTHEINGFDRKLSTTDALGRVTTFDYDTFGTQGTLRHKR
jgi:YD repeat-containing protein